MTNITSRDELKKAFRESEDRFRDLVEGSIEGIMIHRDFKPLFVNSTYAEIFGFDNPEEVMAFDWVLELAAPHVQARAMSYAAARLRGDDAPTDYEYEGLRKDGSTIWLDNRVRVISWQGEPAIQSTVVDITERKRAEEELRRTRDDLELRVQERTRKLTEEITERKRAEEELAALNENLEKRVEERTRALRDSEARLKAILDNSPAAIYLKDLEGRFLLANKTYLNWVNLAPIIHGDHRI